MTMDSRRAMRAVRRFVSTVRQQPTVEARVVIATAPAEEAQVDYGEGPMVRDPDSGKYRRTRLFVLTLGYSRKAVRLLVQRSSAQVWAQLHERAFRRLGGTVRVVVLDNLKEGGRPHPGHLRPDAQSALPRRAGPLRGRRPAVSRPRPRSQGQGRSRRRATPRKTPLRGLRFERLDDGQAYLDRWEQRWADTRIHGTTKRQVAAMFAEERPALGPLPLEPFRYYQYGRRNVHLDGCVEVAAAYYSASARLDRPPRRCAVERRPRPAARPEHRPVPPRAPARATGLASHRRPGPTRPHAAEDPRPARRRQAGPVPPSPPSVTTSTATRAPPASAASSASSLWPRKHGPAVAEDAATAALELGVPTYRFLKRYLDRRPVTPLSLRQVDPLIRQLTLYRDLIDRRTGDPS